MIELYVIVAIKYHTQNLYKPTVAIKDYFILSWVMDLFLILALGCIQTTIAKRGWPINELQVPNNVNFNHLHWCVNNNRTLDMR